MTAATSDCVRVPRALRNRSPTVMPMFISKTYNIRQPDKEAKLLLATLGLGLLLAAVDTKDGVEPDVGVAVAGGSSGLLFAISALYGNNAADDCKAAKAGWKVHEATK